MQHLHEGVKAKGDFDQPHEDAQQPTGTGVPCLSCSFWTARYSLSQLCKIVKTQQQKNTSFFLSQIGETVRGWEFLQFAKD